MNPYEFMLPRLNGEELAKDARPYIELVEKGIAGFILFGGRLEEVRAGIEKLQSHAYQPLIIASDLERGLGQQLEGGTVFPPAMAFGAALENGLSPKVLRRAFGAIATEALYAGVNLVFAPVLDINSNPENPIIATRAFGESPETVAALGGMMIAEFQRKGVIACGKHFPGHGDTTVDSHLALPEIRKNLRELAGFELVPFIRAVEAGVRAMMLGHLKVPALEPSGRPVTVSEAAVAFLRESLKFKGLVITDAMNMAGLSMPEERASVLALKAGVNMILHPSDPDKVAEAIKKSGLKLSNDPVFRTRQKIGEQIPMRGAPYFEGHGKLAREIELKAVSMEGEIESVRGRAVVVLADEPERLNPFMEEVKALGVEAVVNPEGPLPSKDIFAVVYSAPRGWRPPSEGLREKIRRLSGTDAVWLSFGNPYLIRKEKNKVLAYSDSEWIQRETVRMLF